MDPESTSPDGAHALVSLLRDHGVDVVVADDRRRRGTGRPARTPCCWPPRPTTPAVADLLRRLAALPGDRLVLEPTARAPRGAGPGHPDRQLRACSPEEPDCDLREANRAGTRAAGLRPTPTRRSADVDLTRCYGGALVRYQSDGRTVTVVGSADFMTNGALLDEGNAALAMNLAGERPRLIWYAPQKAGGRVLGGSTIGDLIPDAVTWIVFQLCLVVAAAGAVAGSPAGPAGRREASRRGPRFGDRRGPGPALPVPARPRTRPPRRCAPPPCSGSPRGSAWAPTLPAAAVVAAVAQRCNAGPEHASHHILFGPVTIHRR